MIPATKKEAQDALTKARTKAQHAAEASTAAFEASGARLDPQSDAAQLYYQRCVRELEEAINEMARFEPSGDDD